MPLLAAFIATSQVRVSHDPAPLERPEIYNIEWDILSHPISAVRMQEKLILPIEL